MTHIDYKKVHFSCDNVYFIYPSLSYKIMIIYSLSKHTILYTIQFIHRELLRNIT